MGDPPVLLLDEPSSSLDRQAETELRDTLIEIGKDRTVIVVTHSPILLSACDNLVALDKGKVALAGPAKEILPRLFGSKAQQQRQRPTAQPVSAQASQQQPSTSQQKPPQQSPAPLQPQPQHPPAAPAAAATTAQPQIKQEPAAMPFMRTKTQRLFSNQKNDPAAPHKGPGSEKVKT